MMEEDYEFEYLRNEAYILAQKEDDEHQQWVQEQLKMKNPAEVIVKYKSETEKAYEDRSYSGEVSRNNK